MSQFQNKHLIIKIKIYIYILIYSLLTEWLVNNLNFMLEDGG